MTTLPVTRHLRAFGRRAAVWLDELGPTAVGVRAESETGVEERDRDRETSEHAQGSRFDAMRPWQAFLAMLALTVAVILIVLTPAFVLDAVFGALHGAQLRQIFHT